MSIKIEGTIQDNGLQMRLTTWSPRGHANVARAIHRIVQRLRTHIVQNKLRGQVLRRRTGRLGQSIQTKVQVLTRVIVGTVYSAGDVKYAAIHEFGGQTKPHIIQPVKAKALAFKIGAKDVIVKRVNHPGSKIPQRSYMRSSLRDLQQEIENTIENAVRKSEK